MFPRILVAVDGSHTSNLALRKAVALAKEGSSRLRIVHALDLVIGEVEAPYQLADFEASLCQAGEKILKRAAERAHKAEVDADTRLLEVLQYGDPCAAHPRQIGSRRPRPSDHREVRRRSICWMRTYAKA